MAPRMTSETPMTLHQIEQAMRAATSEPISWSRGIESDEVDRWADALAQQRERLQALAAKWQAEGAQLDTFHATMGVGYQVCGEQLAALLAAEEQR